MCLRKVTKKYSPPLKKVRTGYKVMVKFTKNSSAYFSQCRYIGTPHKLGEWSSAVGGVLASEMCSPYDALLQVLDTYGCGFHVCPDIESARLWIPDDFANTNFKMVLVKVEYTDITAEGEQAVFDADGSQIGLHRCEVAKKMRILEEVQDVS